MRIDTVYFRLHKLAGAEISETRIRAKVEVRSRAIIACFCSLMLTENLSLGVFVMM